jgi:DNA-binding PadR family transcriptional regulator
MAPEADLLPGTFDLLILKAVSLGSHHGYGVLLRIEQITDGAPRPCSTRFATSIPG